MTLVVDAGALYAQANAADPAHAAVVAALEAETGLLITCEAAAQGADYLIGARLGVDAELAFLRDLAAGTYEVACMDLAEREQIREVALRYRDLQVGMADATLVVLAARLRTVRLLTLNERHFRAITPLYGESFLILPADN